VDRLETRELAYFVVIAEELNFSRAAERLGIAQPPLSRAIRQLERRMGVALLERSSRHVRLTEAGEVLLTEGRKALDAVTAAGRRAQRAGLSDPQLVLALKPGGDGGLLPSILAAYESVPGALPVDIVMRGIGEPVALLRAGRADVALLHDRHDLTGFDTEKLLVETQVVVLPRWHRLAGRPGVRVADLSGETLPCWPGSHQSDASGPEVHNAGQLMQLIALGRTVAVLPASVGAQLGRDLVSVPVLDAETTTLLIAWPEGSRSRAVAAFVHAATSVATAHM
jgi:DNA-binding transcriptional LysR family regulator